MIETRPLGICNLDEAIGLYRQMIGEYAHQDARLARVETDDRSLKSMLQYSFDVEDELFFVAYAHAEAVGFIDSSRILVDGGADEWYIKAVYLTERFRSLERFAQLVSRVEREVRSRGVGLIFSNALMDDNEANTLWESLGYEIGDRRRTKTLP